MSRRRATGDQEFGSDSFLDIIANIIGILIILIVVVGVKVARQPPLTPELSTSTAAVVALSEPTNNWDDDLLIDLPDVEPIQVSEQALELPDPFAMPNLSDAGNAASEKNAQEDVHDDTTDFTPLAAALESLTEPEIAKATEKSLSDEAQLNQQIESLTLELNFVQNSIIDSERTLEELQAELQNLHTYAQLAEARTEGIAAEELRLTNQISTLKDELSLKEKTATSINATLTSLTSRQKYVSDALDQVTEETRQLRESLEQSEATKPIGERINHRLSPVSRSVQEGELHFRMAAGRIAHIPLEALLERLRSQVASRRSVVAKFHRYEGMVGPEGGFHMKYTVQRDSMPPLQALQQGQSGYRISVSRWSVLPAETLNAETVDAAVKVGSRFRQILEATEPDTVVTIWLYPDDFQYFHQIRELAHRLNLRVAARPLPEGVEIAGSPNGSRSSSQ